MVDEILEIIDKSPYELKIIELEKQIKESLPFKKFQLTMQLEKLKKERSKKT